MLQPLGLGATMTALRAASALMILLAGVAAGLVEGVTAQTTPTGRAISTSPTRIALWLGGQPKSVQAIATTRLHDIEVENTATAIFDYGTGQIGQFYVSTAEVALAETVEEVVAEIVLKVAQLPADRRLGGA